MKTFACIILKMLMGLSFAIMAVSFMGCLVGYLLPDDANMARGSNARTDIEVEIDALNLRLVDDRVDTVQITLHAPMLHILSGFTAADTITIPISVHGEAADRIEKSGNGTDFTLMTDEPVDVVLSAVAVRKTITFRVASDINRTHDSFTIAVGGLEAEGKLAYVQDYRISFMPTPGTKFIDNMFHVDVIDSEASFVDVVLDPTVMQEGAGSMMTFTLHNYSGDDVPMLATIAADIPIAINGGKTKIITLNEALTTDSFPIMSTDEDDVNEPHGVYFIRLSTINSAVELVHPTFLFRVIDNDIPEISIASESTTITEGSGTELMLTATIAPYQDIFVHYEFVGDVSTRDYIDVGNGVATIRAGNTHTVINIEAVDDTEIETDEEITLTLRGITPNEGATLEMMNSVTMVIQDNDTDTDPRTVTEIVIDPGTDPGTDPVTNPEIDLDLDPNADTDGDSILNARDRCPIGVGIDAGWESVVETDADRDGCRDSDEDIDDDNDGLIEIYTLAQLNNIRHNLAGTGYQDSDMAPAVTAGAPIVATTYCDDAADDVYLCGYELMEDLDFDTNGNGVTFTTTGIGIGIVVTGDMDDDYYNGGLGWEPIAHCNSNHACDTPFVGIFEGNGHTISNLFINYSGRVRHSTGLFGGATNQIQNLELTSVYVGNTIDDDDNVGGLVGYGRDVTVQNVTVRGIVHSARHVETHDTGGIVGDGQASTIASSRFHGTVIGSRLTGGIVGAGSTVIGSSVTGDANDIITGIVDIGGLMGHQDGGTVVANYTDVAVESWGNTADRIGGLIGHQLIGTIVANYTAGNVNGGDRGNDFVGGLVGLQDGGAVIRANYTVGDMDGGDGDFDFVGHIAGRAHGTVTASYGFGSVDAGREAVGVSPILPMGVVTALDLTAATAGSCSDGTVIAATQATCEAASGIWTSWNAQTGGMHAWNFGDGTQTPALRFADYDGAGGTDYCSTVIPSTFNDGSAITCGPAGTLIPGQR